MKMHQNGSKVSVPPEITLKNKPFGKIVFRNMMHEEIANLLSSARMQKVHA